MWQIVAYCVFHVVCGLILARYLARNDNDRGAIMWMGPWTVIVLGVVAINYVDDRIGRWTGIVLDVLCGKRTAALVPVQEQWVEVTRSTVEVITVEPVGYIQHEELRKAA